MCVCVCVLCLHIYIYIYIYIFFIYYIHIARARERDRERERERERESGARCFVLQFFPLLDRRWCLTWLPADSNVVCMSSPPGRTCQRSVCGIFASILWGERPTDSHKKEPRDIVPGGSTEGAGR